MSIPKAAGIETEYGIIIWGATAFNPFMASQLVLDAYRGVGGPAISTWGYYGMVTGEVIEPESEENPLNGDLPYKLAETTPAGGHKTGKQGGNGSGQAVTYGLGSLMLANGARYYVDHTHPEYCTPETLLARGVVAADKAGERIVARCLNAVNRAGTLPPGQQVMVYKNNSDQKGNSYGCHENYLLSKELFENLLHRRSHMIYRYLLPFLISRVVMCGAGKVGAENRTAAAGFQLAQRADFFEMLMGPQTTYRRPLFNTRDESHTDSNAFRRLHVILGDANMSEIATYLKVGTTQLVLHMIEDGFVTDDLTLADPLAAFQAVSRDLTFAEPLFLESGQQMTAVELQEKFLELAEQYLDRVGGTDDQWEVWQQWADVVDALAARDMGYLERRLDWAIKKTVLDRYLQGQGTGWDEVLAWQPAIETVISAELAGQQNDTLARVLVQSAGLNWDDYARQRDTYFGLRRLDLEYHDIRSRDVTETGGTDVPGEIGLFYRLQERGLVERLLSDEEIARCIAEPPSDTRAWLRGKTVGKFARHIVAADWSYVKLQHQDPSANLVYRLEFPNPLVGTEADLKSVWDRFETPDQMFAYFYRA